MPKFCAFFSGLPSACSELSRSPPSHCIAANRSMLCGWWSPRFQPMPSDIASTAVLFRPKCWRLIRCARLPRNVWKMAATLFRPINGSSSDTTSPPSPAPGRWSGPCLAAQFGYLPGTLWIIAGAVLGGCVQDFVILLFSVRRDGKSLTEMAKSEIGRVGGIVAYVAVLSIIVILLGATALIVVNALKSSPWGTFTIAMTMPIAVLMGVYLRRIRPGKVLETSVCWDLCSCSPPSLADSGFRNTPSWAAIFTLTGSHAGNSDHRLWIRRVRAAGMAAARAARLSEHVRETRNDFSAGGWHRGASSIAAHAAADALCRWHRPGICRNDLSFCIYHHRVRRHQRIPFADLQRHDAEADPPRNRKRAWLATAECWPSRWSRSWP